MAEDDPPVPGPTGDFPDGQLGPDDAGALALSVGVVEGRIVVDFGKDVRWLGLEPAQAYGLAQALLEAARRATGGRVQ